MEIDMKKIIFAVYAMVTAITCVCAFIFEDQLNIVVDSLIPLGVMVVHVALGILLLKEIAYFYGGKVRMLSNVDFKYKKDERGDGKLEVVDHYRAAHNGKERIAVGYTFLISGAFAIPFMVFFPIATKWASIALFFIPTFIGSGIAIFLNFKGLRDDMKMMGDEYEKQKKELEDQRKREELGRWK